ncbi:MAG: hypothetical protein M9962_15375 [Oligoflexia bacterium]|nr:hypothetical protein [Oligoflexia bacterium]
MRTFISQLAIFLIPLLCMAEEGGGGDGTIIGNGGGSAEQALLYSVEHHHSFLQSCLSYSQCSGTGEKRSILLKLSQKNSLPMKAIQFVSRKEEPRFYKPIPFLWENQTLFINRELLYKNGKTPLSVPKAFPYFTKILLEIYGIQEFAKSEWLVNSMEGYIELESERVTIGKDQLNLPAKNWIKIRTLFSDLLFESNENFYRFSCSEPHFASCNFNNKESRKDLYFTNLVLVKEAYQNNEIQFLIEGYFSEKNHFFSLRSAYKNGKMQSLNFNGKEIVVPQDDESLEYKKVF